MAADAGRRTDSARSRVTARRNGPRGVPLSFAPSSYAFQDQEADVLLLRRWMPADTNAAVTFFWAASFRARAG